VRAATAGMVSAAVLMAPGCGGSPATPQSKDEPVRRASYRSIAAREFLASCPGATARPETLYQESRHEELKQLAARNGAGTALALGENEWAGMSRHSRRERCAPGERAYRRALSAFGGALDGLAARIAEYRP
jgi:hypothetical protein